MTNRLLTLATVDHLQLEAMARLRQMQVTADHHRPEEDTNSNRHKFKLLHQWAATAKAETTATEDRHHRLVAEAMAVNHPRQFKLPRLVAMEDLHPVALDMVDNHQLQFKLPHLEAMVDRLRLPAAMEDNLVKEQAMEVQLDLEAMGVNLLLQETKVMVANNRRQFKLLQLLPRADIVALHPLPAAVTEDHLHHPDLEAMAANRLLRFKVQ